MMRFLSIPVLLVGLSSPAPETTRWRMELRENDGTELSIRMTFRIEGERWELHSRPGAANALINWRQRLLGRLTGKLPPRGALIYGTGRAVASSDSLLLRGDIRSELLGRRILRGSLRGGRFQGDLIRTSDTTNVTGRLDGAPWTSEAPLRNYPAIAQRTRDSIQGLIYDPSIGTRPNMVRFFARFAESAERALDDLDLIAGFVAAQPLIGISHFGFVRNPRIATTPLDSLVAGDRAANTASLVNFSLWGDGSVAYLRVRRWDRATPFIRRAFERMDSAGTRVLVLDITGNGGGDATALTPATHLFRDTVRAGFLLGRPWYAAHSGPPTPAQIEQFAVIDDEERAKQLLKIVTSEGAAHARFAPRPPYFGGTVYLVVDDGTGSASEFLAYLLKSTKRATLYGRRTRGAVLTALPHPVGDGFIVTVPEADYFTQDGKRLEGKGIHPDVVSDDPNVAVDEEIRKTLPYPALIMLGQIAFNRRQFDRAEAQWTEARALAPNDQERQAIDRRIAMARSARKP
jgi:carboxyl-terminal processing protease